MIDPITLSAAVTGATTAYNAIKKAIMVGKESLKKARGKR